MAATRSTPTGPHSGAYTLNGNAYTAAQVGTFSGRIDLRKAGAYLGIGWGHGVTQGKGWFFDGHVGVLFQGSPHSNLTSSGCTASAVLCQQLATDVAAENTSLHDKVENFQHFPSCVSGQPLLTRSGGPRAPRDQTEQS